MPNLLKCVLLKFIRSYFLQLIRFKANLTMALKNHFYGLSSIKPFPPFVNTFSFTWVKNPKPVKSSKQLLNPIYSYTPVVIKDSFQYFINYLAQSVQVASYWWLNAYRKTFGDGFLYLRGLFIIFFVDALIADDEPIWEPVEWSLLQSWILFIFLFAWIAENLISSRYGSYTGRDKRVWFGWYKTYWMIEGWYVLSMGMASLWVMVPHYYEVTYGVSFIVSWWNWYSRVFVFKFISIYSLVLFIAYFLQISVRWINWKKAFYLILAINFFLGYLLYTQFFISFFGYFTDPRWYSKTRLVDYIQLSHEPSRWGWGDIKRDHFTHHRSKTVFWFKNDGPYASAFLFYNIMFFIALFSLYFYWIALIRRVYVTQEVTYTLTTYCISSLKQFFYFFLLIFLLIFLSYMFIYWRIPNEFLWTINATSWFSNLVGIVADYPSFVWNVLVSTFK